MIGITPVALTLIGRKSGLTTVHLTTNYALCVLDRDTALCIGHIYDENDQCQTNDDHEHCEQCNPLAPP